MEKRGVIEPGRTPPEDGDAKQASDQSLEDHVTKRAAEAARKAAEESKDGRNGMQSG